MSNPCQITAPHGEHPVLPLVVDPNNDRVLHLMADTPLICPGVPSEASDLEWRRAAWGFSHYEVSNYGDVRSFGNSGYRVLSPQINPKGYVTFNLYREDGVRREVRVHRLVMETFVGPMPPGLEVRHLDDVKENNHVSNLAYGTRAENVQDGIKNGVWKR